MSKTTNKFSAEVRERTGQPEPQQRGRHGQHDESRRHNISANDGRDT